MPNSCGIYTITNLIDGKIYVGCSNELELRLKHHWNSLEGKRHRNPYLQNAWDKYGKQNFKIEVLWECEEGLLASEEHYWCNILNVHNPEYGYNIRPTHPEGLQRSSKDISEKAVITRKKTAKEKGYYHSEETRQKIAKSNTGKKHSKERIEKAKEGLKKTLQERGYTITEETREKMSKAHKGRKLSKESIQKSVEKRKGRKQSPDAVLRMTLAKFGNRKIEVYNKDNILVFTCNFQKEAAEFLGVTTAAVLRILMGYNKKTRKGYTLKYEYIQAA